MKDLVQNRQRVSWRQKWEMARLLLKENGFIWCAFFSVYYVSSSLAESAFARMSRMRTGAELPGLNGRAMNKAIWQSWDWSAGGEEWTLSEEWKDSLVKCVLEKWVPEETAVLEIGPGGGRWTGYLIDRGSSYRGVDISESCIEVCRTKFASESDVAFHVGSGCDLAMIADESVDVLWSFDVFVHINTLDVAQYTKEFRRVLKKGAVGIIHHGTVGGAKGGWRSDLTMEKMKSLLAGDQLEIVESFSNWADGDESHPVGLYEDAVTVFRRQ